MIALDTNVVVRFLVRDDERQAERARRLLQTEEVFLPLTVLLESEWILRSAYENPSDKTAAALKLICGFSNVRVEQPEVARRALDAYGRGWDFADALHVFAAEAGGAMTFATFDRDLKRKIGGSVATSIKPLGP